MYIWHRTSGRFSVVVTKRSELPSVCVGHIQFAFQVSGFSLIVLKVRTKAMRSGNILHGGRAKAVPRGHVRLDCRLDIVRMQRALSDWELLP